MKLNKVVNALISTLFFINNAWSCIVTPSFTYTTTHSCGLPTFINASNTSTGTFVSGSKFWWKADNALFSDTITGTASCTLMIKYTGNVAIKLFVKDSAGCIDSVTTTVTITSNAKTILDQNLIYSHSPTWMNCLQFISDPDSFRINFESADTLKNLKVIWGDGNSDLSGNQLLPNTPKSHLYNNLGIFKLKIITTNGTCIDTVYGIVYNQRQPTAGIIGPPSGSNRGCVPHTLRVINNSYNISDNTNFKIEWGNGEVQTLPYTAYQDTIYHTYTKGKGVCAGIIKITATNVCGSSFTTWNPIDISDKDKAAWSVTSTCNPTGSYVFQNNSSDNYCLIPDIKEYFWDFGDSTTVGWTTSKAPQSHNYKKEGDYNVKLIAKTACGNDTFQKKVYVYYNPVAAFMSSNVRGCKPLNVTLTDTSKGRGNTRKWTVVNGSTTTTYTDSIINITFTSAGINSVTLSVSNICNSSSITKNFVVNDKPVAALSNVSNTCIPAKISFGNVSTSYFNNPTYTWDFGDGTGSTLKNPPLKTYLNSGTYTVKLIIRDSCGVDSTSRTFTAFGLPQAVLSGDTAGCTFDSLNLINRSVNSNSYAWDFGNGNTKVTTDTGVLRYAYAVQGSYTIKLIASAGSGCKDTAEMPVILRPGAKAQFSVDKQFACNPATFKVTNNSIYARDYRWYANGKLISTAFNPNDTLLNNDTSKIRLTLITTSNSSCQSDSAVYTFFTPKNPVAQITDKDSGCGPLTIQLNNTSSNAYSYFWQSGITGVVSNLKTPSFTYPSAISTDTIYRPKLVVSNWAGCKDSATSSLKVYPIPDAVFDVDKTSGCGPLTVQFVNSSVTNNALPTSTLSHHWNFSNGDTSVLTSPSSIFIASLKKDSIYQVVLTVTSLNACKDRDTALIKVYPQPNIRFTPDKPAGCAILDVNFNNSSLPNDTGSIAIMKFRWNSGNGTTSTNKNFNASYKASLNGDTVYNVMLRGETEHGCADSLIKPITVHPQPIADFNPDKTDGCTPLRIKTINRSYSPDAGPVTHQWSFGNTYFSTNRTDSSIYINNSQSDVNYTIQYQVISQYGCRDTSSAIITVRPQPKIKFTVNSGKMCAPALLVVNDSSINAFKHYWSIGSAASMGGKKDTLLLPGMQLFDSTYIVSHFVESIYGCFSDTSYQKVQVVGKPKADFIFSGDSLCTDERLFLTNLSLGSIQYKWTFGDGSSSTQINAIHKYPASNVANNDTTFKTRLEAISSYGCRDTIAKSVTLINKPSEKFKFDKQLGCTDLRIELNNPSNRFKTVSWDFGDNTSEINKDSVSHVFVNNTGNLTFQPKITLIRSRYNCIDTTYQYAFIYPKPTANFRVLRIDPCNDGTYQFSNLSLNATGVDWYIDSNYFTSANAFNKKLDASAFKDSFYHVRIINRNAYGCMDTADQTIKVKSKLKIAFEKTPPISCEDAFVKFTNLSTNSVRYFWKFGDGALSNDVNPTHAYNSFGNYQIKLYGYDKDGCVDSSDGTAFCKVLERPRADFTFNPLNPKLPNATVNFFATPGIVTANVDDLIYDWNFGDNTYPTVDKGLKDPVHTYFNPGNIAVSLMVSNQGCSDSIVKYIFVEYAKPEPAFTADTLEGCSPFRVKFTNTTKYATSFRWMFGDGTPDAIDENPTHIFDLPGTFDVTLVATGPGGVTTLKKNLLITTYPRPFLDFYTNKRFLTLPNALFNMMNNSNSVKNSWDVIDSTGAIVQSSKLRDPSFILNTVGLYDIRLIGTNSYGCVDTLIKTDYIGTLTQGYVYVPNAFSPNKNSKNDGFYPSLYNVMDRNYSFEVFNRWGEMVFQTNDIHDFWDGTFKGNVCEQDVYIWTVKGEYYNNDLFSFRGTVTLLR
ncbi:MAG TPA: PKD domain-containing protein [Bacteroidia bacterium]